MGTTKPTLVLYGLALFASFEYPELCLYCRSCNITMTVLMGMTCYQKEYPMITWEESDMFCFIGDNGFIDSSPDLDYTLVVLQIGLKIQSC